MNNEFIAKCFLGRDMEQAEASELINSGKDGGDPILIFDPLFQPSKRNMLLLTSCHAFPMRHYMSARRIHNDYNINIVLVHRAICVDCDIRKSDLIKAVISNSSIIVANPFVGQYENLRLDRINAPTGCLCLNYVPPNNAAMWPIAEHFGERGVVHALNCGKSRFDIWEDFISGRFEPFFADRWAAQIARLYERERECQCLIASFSERNIRRCKLWFTENHPTYNVIAWICAQIEKAAGYECQSEDEIVLIPSDAYGTWNVHPETEYEFKHYRLEYPMKYKNAYGGNKWYHEIINRIADKFFPGLEAADGAASF